MSAFAIGDALLIDSGFPHAWRNQVARARAWRTGHCLLTHHDEDHSGGAAILAVHGCRVFASEAALPLLRTRPRLQPYQRIIWGTPTPMEAEPLPEVVRYPRGVLQVLPTPGHSHDHVAFFEPEQRWVFGGDLFIGVKTRLARRHENIPQLIESLRFVASLEPSILFDAHAGVIPNARRALEEKIGWLTELREKARLLRDRGHSVKRIRRRLLGREPLALRLLTAGDFSKTNLVHSLLAD